MALTDADLPGLYSDFPRIRLLFLKYIVHFCSAATAECCSLWHFGTTFRTFHGSLKFKYFCAHALNLSKRLRDQEKVLLFRCLFFAFCALFILVFLIICFSKFRILFFHKIFFDNDLWILDPATDLLINIVPEPFFMDTAARIGVTFGLMVLFLFAVCLAFILFTKKRKPLTPAFTNRG